MKRCRFGGVLLVLLLISGLLLSREMGEFQLELSEIMARAAVLTGENRAVAQAEAEAAKAAWEHRRRLTSVLNDHAPMEAIGENFALLTPSAEEEDFRETCLRLSEQLKALGEGQRLNWENLF